MGFLASATNAFFDEMEPVMMLRRRFDSVIMQINLLTAFCHLKFKRYIRSYTKTYYIGLGTNICQNVASVSWISEADFLGIDVERCQKRKGIEHFNGHFFHGNCLR